MSGKDKKKTKSQAEQNVQKNTSGVENVLSNTTNFDQTNSQNLQQSINNSRNLKELFNTNQTASQKTQDQTNISSIGAPDFLRDLVTNKAKKIGDDPDYTSGVLENARQAVNSGLGGLELKSNPFIDKLTDTRINEFDNNSEMARSRLNASLASSGALSGSGAVLARDALEKRIAQGRDGLVADANVNNYDRALQEALAKRQDSRQSVNSALNFNNKASIGGQLNNLPYNILLEQVNKNSGVSQDQTQSVAEQLANSLSNARSIGLTENSAQSIGAKQTQSEIQKIIDELTNSKSSQSETQTFQKGFSPADVIAIAAAVAGGG